MTRNIKVVDFIHGKKDSDKVNTSLPFTTNYKETKSVQSANVVIASYTNKNSKDIETLNVKNNLIENNITDIYNTLDIIDTALNNITSDIEDINIEINNLNGEIINKQDTLVSGNNIKTINNNSILGSGNIEIASSGGTWGEIVGTLSNQTDLQNALDEKADISELPTKTSELINDSDFIDSSYHDSSKQNILTAGSNIVIENDTISANVPSVVNDRTVSTNKTYSTNYINNITEYSTSEVLVGRVNGRNLYKKLIVNENINVGTLTIYHGIQNLEMFVGAYGFAKRKDGTMNVVPRASGDEWKILYNDFYSDRIVMTIGSLHTGNSQIALLLTNVLYYKNNE